MSDVLIIGVDPGKTSGVARYDTLTGKFTAVAVEGGAVPCGQTVGDLLGESLKHYSTASDPTIVLAVEAYSEGGGIRTAQPDALETIGVMRWLARLLHLDLLVQGAGAATAAAPREVLQATGWWTVGDPEQHRNRAAAQVALAALQVMPDRWYEMTTKT